MATLHLCGVGQVGREVLDLIAISPGLRLVAVSDSSGTIARRAGLDPHAILAHKLAGRRVAELDGASDQRTEDAAGAIDSDILVDAMPTDTARPARARAVGDAVLQRGGALALASKAGLCAAVDAWLAPAVRARVGCNAVLGGAGLGLRRELDALRERTVEAAHCGSATTTWILEVIERGGTLEQGIEGARRAGILEPDPELDLTGADAAVKLAIVAGALRGAPVDPRAIALPDLRELEAATLRARAARGATTRLVGRVRGDALTLAFEELPRTSPLVAPWDRVVYGYDLDGGDQRLHVGAGIGPRGTAEALWRDVQDSSEPSPTAP